MCEKNEALFSWIDVERPIKWTFIQKKIKEKGKIQKIEKGKSKKNPKEKISKKKLKKIEKEKEFVFSSPGQNVCLLSLPYS